EPPLTPVSREGPQPLSFAQQALWVMDRMEGRSAHYNEFGAQLIQGPLDVENLRRALEALMRRHEVLRARFVERTEGVGQEIAAPTAFSLPVEPTTEAALPARAAELMHAPFDL